MIEMNAQLLVLTLLTTVYSNSTRNFSEVGNVTESDYYTSHDKEMLVARCSEDILKGLKISLKENDPAYILIENNGNWSDNFVFCPKVDLTVEDFCAINNLTIYVPTYSKAYNCSDYYFSNNILFVCAPSVITDEMKLENGTKTKDVNRVFGILTIVGISISNTCLGLHILAFILIPEMRNLPGKNLASLTIAVFFSFLFFAISFYFIEYKVACVVVALLTYYFLVSSFLWMNIIGFEIWRSLQLIRNEMGSYAKSQEMQRYLRYCIFGWATPVVLVCIIIIIDNSPNVNPKYRPDLGKSKCWFGELIPLIIFFLTPLIFVMVSNLLFFTWSSLVICRTDKLSRNKRSEILVKRFTSNFRLFIVTGLTWVFGIVHYVAKNEVTSYIFIILTAFYGLFVFVSFTLTTKVFRKLRNIFPFMGKWLPSTSVDSSESRECKM